MKTLIVYDNNGNIESYKTINDDKSYGLLVVDINKDKRPLKIDVENKKCILTDSFEIQEKKRKIKEKLDGELNTTIKKLEDNEDFIKSKQNESLCLQAFIIDIKYQKLELLK